MSVCGVNVCDAVVDCDRGVCFDKVCEAVVECKQGLCYDRVCRFYTACNCHDLIPYACGNTMPVTFASCGTDTFIPSGRCLGTELYAPTCD